jgi:hypothetical protein
VQGELKRIDVTLFGVGEAGFGQASRRVHVPGSEEQVVNASSNTNERW